MISLKAVMDNYIEQHRAPVDMTRPDDSPMVHYYRDKCVFLTGGTGFLGQLYVEKLLRAGVRLIYVLARPKKGKSTGERLAETFSGDVFQRLAAIDPQYMDRVRAVDGDMGVLKLGISDADWAEIKENVQIVLHSAADVRFDETLLDSLLINLRGTREVLRLAEAIVHLEVYVHISTAYSHCPNMSIEERFYEVPVRPDVMIELAESIQDGDQEQFKVLSNVLIQPWPNTYTYTKALAEELVRGFGERIPVIVMRPSIVISTNSDPIPGWINNVYGLTGVLLACGMGFQRFVPLSTAIKPDFVCADYVINSTLAAAWATNQERLESSKLSADLSNNEISHRNAIAIPDPKVYHVISYQDRPTKMTFLMDSTVNTLFDLPSERSLWKPSTSTTDWSLLSTVLVVLYHVIPAFLFDTVFWATGSKMRLMPMYRKTHKFIMASTYFMTQEWAFANSQMKAVYARMSHDDRRFFPSDVRESNFRDFATIYTLGIRIYILRELEVNERWAHTRMRLLCYAHMVVLAVLYAGYALLAYAVLLQSGYWPVVASLASWLRAAIAPQF